MKIVRPKSIQPIPENAKKVFEGVIFDVYQWEQKLYDGSTSTFEKVKRPDSVFVFPVLDNGDILLTKQEQPGLEPFIGVPGGRIDQGESVLEAARRELLEETGYEAEEFVLWKAVQPIMKVEWAIYFLVAHGLKKITKTSLDAGEKIKPMSVSFDEFLEIAIKPNFSEKEIYSDVAEAMLDETKKTKLKKLLSKKE